MEDIEVERIKFRKRIKGGLPKCQLHFHGTRGIKIPLSSEYRRMFDGWYQCLRCKKFIEVPEGINDHEISVSRAETGNHIVFRTSDADYVKLNFSV